MLKSLLQRRIISMRLPAMDKKFKSGSGPDPSMYYTVQQFLKLLTFKGTLTRDFRRLVFFIKQLPPEAEFTNKSRGPENI
jgi:hypothetical protein